MTTAAGMRSTGASCRAAVALWCGVAQHYFDVEPDGHPTRVIADLKALPAKQQGGQTKKKRHTRGAFSA